MSGAPVSGYPDDRAPYPDDRAPRGRLDVAPVSAPPTRGRARVGPRRDELRSGQPRQQLLQRADTGEGPRIDSYPRRSTSPYPDRVGREMQATAARQRPSAVAYDELYEDVQSGPLAAIAYTLGWYGVPVVLTVLYMLFLNSEQQARALGTLASAAPQFGASLLLSLVVAVLLRRISGAWKSASVGLAAAVMGGGLATVLMSAITGQALG